MKEKTICEWCEEKRDDDSLAGCKRYIDQGQCPAGEGLEGCSDR